MLNRPIIRLRSRQNAAETPNRPIIQLNPTDQFPTTKNTSFYIHEVTGSIEEAKSYGPIGHDIDVGIPRPISKDVLATRYKENLEYVRTEVERANLSKHRMVFTEAAEDGSRKMAGNVVEGADVGKRTFIAFVSQENLNKHGIQYNLQGGVNFGFDTKDVTGQRQNPFLKRIRDMMIKSGTVQEQTEAYKHMMESENFIFVNSRKLVSDSGPIGALKTTFHEIGHSFSTASGLREQQLSENVVSAFDRGLQQSFESGIDEGISAIKRQVIGHALEEARAETFALGILNKQGLIGDLVDSSVDSIKSKGGQTKKLLSYADKSAFDEYGRRYTGILSKALESRTVTFHEATEADALFASRADEISTAAHAAFHRNVIIPSDMQPAFEPLRKRLISNTYNELLKKGRLSAESELEGEIKSMKEVLSLQDELFLEEMMEDLGVSSKAEVEAILEAEMRQVAEAKLQTASTAAQDYAEKMSPIVGKPVDSLPVYHGSQAKDLDDSFDRIMAAIKQNPQQNPEHMKLVTQILKDQGADQNRINELLAHAGLSSETKLPSLAGDASDAAAAVIKSSKQVGLEDSLGFGGRFLGKKVSRNYI